MAGLRTCAGMSIVLRGPTGMIQPCCHGLFIGRSELGLPASTRISRRHLQILRRAEPDSGAAAARGRWEVWRTGMNSVTLMRPGAPSVEIEKARGVAIQAGDSLVVASQPGEPPDPAQTLEVIISQPEQARKGVRVRRPRAGSLPMPATAPGDQQLVSNASSSSVDLTSPLQSPHESITISSDSDDDVVVVRTVRGDSNEVVVVGESRQAFSRLRSSDSTVASITSATAPAAGATSAAEPATAAASAPTARRGLTRKRAFSCPICMMDCDPDEGYTLSCTHSFCAACVGQYAAIKVKDGEVSQQQLICPSEDCKAPLTAGDVEGVLTHAENGAELWSKFDQFRLTRYVEQEETSHYCPGAGCTYMFFVAPPDRHQTRFDCPQCTGSYCLRCKGKWHDGNCPVPEHESMSEYMKNTKLKQCPNCKNMVEKAEGCNAVPCRCGIQFCFLCGKQIQAAGQKMTAALCQGCDPYVIQHRNQPVLSAAQRCEFPHCTTNLHDPAWWRYALSVDRSLQPYYLAPPLVPTAIFSVRPCFVSSRAQRDQARVAQAEMMARVRDLRRVDRVARAGAAAAAVRKFPHLQLSYISFAMQLPGDAC